MLVSGMALAYYRFVSHDFHEERKSLKMVPCGGCGAKNFVAADIPPLSAVACTRCGAAIMMPMRLRQFELRGVIGEGGMGTVYRSWDTTLDREVAVKLMKKELVGDAQAIENFSREARACAALNHTNIIHIYTFDEHKGQWFIVMEIADRGSLDSRIESDKVVPELLVLDVGIKVASALASALKHNLLHRDIKPGNILFNSEGEPKLVDFGLARNTESNAEDDGAVWGTPYYIAPEKIRREREDFLSDMYSLAGTLYHALTGHVPFEAPTVDEVVAAHVHTPLTPPNLVVPEITQATSDALVCAMAKRPEDRYQSYDEFIMALTASRSQLLVNQYRNQERSTTSGASTAPAGKSWWRL
jgi:eukaryotic-like serine/threonine-protein kinase